MKQTISRFFMLCLVGMACMVANAQIPNNEIWYTTADGEIVKPREDAYFGANIISNTYNNGKGVIKFDGDVVRLESTPETFGGHRIFDGQLLSMTLPNSLTAIGDYAFKNSTIRTIKLPQYLKKIGNSAFSEADLESIDLPQTLVFIGNCALGGTFTELVIPKSVTYIDDWAIPSSVKEVTVFWDKPISIYRNTFGGEKGLQRDSKLYVPENTYDNYAYAAFWMDFGQIIEVGQCKKPTIAYENGKLKFHSETPNAKYEYSITDTDVKNETSTNGELQLSATYAISVKATSDNKTDSETATATLCWINQKPEETGTTGVIDVKANPVLIQSENGVISVSGIDDDESVSVFSTAGMQLGHKKSFNGRTTISVNANRNDVVIVKIGDNSVKVRMQ